VRAHDIAQPIGIDEAARIQRRNAGAKLRGVQPIEPLYVEDSTRSAGIRRVERNDAQRPRVDRKACVPLKRT